MQTTTHCAQRAGQASEPQGLEEDAYFYDDEVAAFREDGNGDIIDGAGDRWRRLRGVEARVAIRELFATSRVSRAPRVVARARQHRSRPAAAQASDGGATGSTGDSPPPPSSSEGSPPPALPAGLTPAPSTARREEAVL